MRRDKFIASYGNDIEINILLKWPSLLFRLQVYIYYEIVHEAHKKENKVIDLTITQDCK